MKSKKKMILGLAVGLSVLAAVPAFAGEWKQDTKGWWYQEDDGSYPTSAWKEINGRQYYFGADGYLLTNTTTPDGYTVNDDGAWTVNGVVQETQKKEGTWLGEYKNENSKLAYEIIRINELSDNALEVTFSSPRIIYFGVSEKSQLTWDNSEKTIASHSVAASLRYEPANNWFGVPAQGTVKETLELLSDSIRITYQQIDDNGSVIRTDTEIFRKTRSIEELNAEAQEERERRNYLNGTNDDGTLNEHGKMFDYDHDGYLDSKELADLWADNADWSQF